MSLDELVQALATHPYGLCGQGEPARAIASILEVEMRLRVLALGAILDVFPDAQRWRVIATLSDHWLLDTENVAYRTIAEVASAMHTEGIVTPRHTPAVWRHICQGVQGRFKGSMRELLRANSDHAFAVQVYLAKSRTTFPVLAGSIVSARWLDLVHRIGRLPLAGWEALQVSLTPTQHQVAVMFGITEPHAHPATAAALRVWIGVCRQFGPGQCGLASCPRRKLAQK